LGKNMKLLIGFTVTVLFVVGCAHVMTPEEVRIALEQRERVWKEGVTRRYDLDALVGFVRRTIAEKKVWDGVDLTAAKLDPMWAIGGQSCGDWYFRTLDPEKDEFILRSNFQREKRSLDFRCVREGRGAFRIVEVASQNFPDTLIPFTTKEPNQAPEPAAPSGRGSS
jgi:hypothetical protein